VCLLKSDLELLFPVFSLFPGKFVRIRKNVPHRKGRAFAAMLADVPVGERPIGGDCSIATVVISDRGKGDRPDGKLGSKSPGWLGKNPGQIRQGDKQLNRP
jgi:hypothetical protein